MFSRRVMMYRRSSSRSMKGSHSRDMSQSMSFIHDVPQSKNRADLVKVKKNIVGVKQKAVACSQEDEIQEDSDNEEYDPPEEEQKETKPDIGEKALEYPSTIEPQTSEIKLGDDALQFLPVSKKSCPEHFDSIYETFSQLERCCQTSWMCLKVAQSTLVCFQVGLMNPAAAVCVYQNPRQDLQTIDFCIITAPSHLMAMV